MIRNVKDITLIGVCVAILIGGQLALSAVSGIEIVTVLLLCFSFSFGISIGLAIATVFSLLRCLIFGFYINIIILYLIYYNLFALYFGWLGKRTGKWKPLTKTFVAVASATLFTVSFTLLDDVITPLFLGFNHRSTVVYFYASLYSLIPQTICTAVTVSVLFVPLTRVLKRLYCDKKTI